jgi:hypothetical protein
MNVKDLEIKISFNPILNFGFNLGHLKCTPIASNGVNFAKDYQKDSYIKRIFIAKNIDDKNLLATFKKHSYF